MHVCVHNVIQQNLKLTTTDHIIALVCEVTTHTHTERESCIQFMRIPPEKLSFIQKFRRGYVHELFQAHLPSSVQHTRMDHHNNIRLPQMWIYTTSVFTVHNCGRGVSKHESQQRARDLDIALARRTFRGLLYVRNRFGIHEPAVSLLCAR